MKVDFRATAVPLALTAALLLALMGCFAVAEGEYQENEWNYVEGSMDVSHGIPEDAGGVLMRIRETGELRVATEPYFPPQEFIDPSKSGQDAYVGSDMQMARRIAQRMGVQLKIVPMEFSEVLDAVAEGSCDLAISALSYTPERAGRVTLSRGYFFSEDNAGTGLMIRQADAGVITGIEALAERDIAAQSGSLQEAQMAENVPFYRQFRRLPSLEDVYAALRSGRADAIAVNMEAGRKTIESDPGCGMTFIEGVVFKMEPQFEGDRVAARKGEVQLIAFVNGVIDELAASGEYDRWYSEAEALAAEVTK